MLDHILVVWPIHDSEGCGKGNIASVLAQHDIGEGVESPAGHLLTTIVHEEACPSQHLLGGPTGKGQEQD